MLTRLTQFQAFWTTGKKTSSVTLNISLIVNRLVTIFVIISQHLTKETIYSYHISNFRRPLFTKCHVLSWAIVAKQPQSFSSFIYLFEILSPKTNLILCNTSNCRHQQYN